MKENILLQKYRNAISEAKRFLEKAEIAEKAIAEYEYYYCGKATSAAKRSSMDLSRVLSELRKSN
ncbi:MAG: hypothetical protein WCJ81_09010 [bacterium]